MKLNVRKVRKEMDRLGWTLEDLAKASKLKSRQSAFHHLSKKTIRGAELFGKAMDIDPKDLLIS